MRPENHPSQVQPLVTGRYSYSISISNTLLHLDYTYSFRLQQQVAVLLHR